MEVAVRVEQSKVLVERRMVHRLEVVGGEDILADEFRIGVFEQNPN